MKLRYCSVLPLLTVSLLSNVAHAVSFNCINASRWSENMICNHRALSDLDDLLAKAYKKTIIGSSNKALLQAQQQEWLQYVRDACQSVDCLKQAYTTRLAELNAHVDTATPVSSAHITGDYSRLAVVNAKATVSLREDGDGFLLSAQAQWQDDVAKISSSGEVEGRVSVKDNTIKFSDGQADGCQFLLRFVSDGIDVSGDNGQCGGMNVSFNGHYIKTTP